MLTIDIPQKRIRQNWFYSNGRRVEGENSSQSHPLDQAVDFTGYPQIRKLRNMSDVENAFKTGGKTYIKNLPKVDVITIVRYKVCTGPTVPTFEQLKCYTVDELRAAIYRKVGSDPDTFSIILTSHSNLKSASLTITAP